MKTILITIFTLFICIVCSWGQSFEKNAKVTTDRPLPKVTAQPYDTLQAVTVSSMASLPTALPAFHLSDSVSQPNLCLSRPVFSRAPFFVNEQFSVALGKSNSNFRYENITSFGTSFLIRPLDKLTIDITPVISHYIFGNKQISPFTDFSCSFAAQYDLSEKIAVKTFGQVSSSTNKFYGYAPFVPQNAYGVGLKYKANKNLSFEVSVEQSKYNGMWYHEHNGTLSDY